MGGVREGSSSRTVEASSHRCANVQRELEELAPTVSMARRSAPLERAVAAKAACLRTSRRRTSEGCAVRLGTGLGTRLGLGSGENP